MILFGFINCCWVLVAKKVLRQKVANKRVRGLYQRIDGRKDFRVTANRVADVGDAATNAVGAICEDRLHSPAGSLAVQRRVRRTRECARGRFRRRRFSATVQGSWRSSAQAQRGARARTTVSETTKLLAARCVGARGPRVLGRRRWTDDKGADR